MQPQQRRLRATTIASDEVLEVGEERVRYAIELRLRHLPVCRRPDLGAADRLVDRHEFEGGCPVGHIVPLETVVDPLL
eukprot:5313777-Pyramimonas_sp.AAC.1